MAANNKLSGVILVDGTKEGFTTDTLDKNKIYFVRTNSDGSNGYIYINGKKYGKQEYIINCGKY